MSSATSSGAAESAQTFISIHALTRSATRVFTSSIHLNPKFQSTHSQGVRRINHTITTYTNAISIHALTRSATQNRFSRPFYLLYFNPRTREECDFGFYLFSICFSYFNPRTHEECDSIPCNILILQVLISIHALTRSATCAFRHKVTHRLNFNPRTHEECDTSGKTSDNLLR